MSRGLHVKVRYYGVSREAVSISSLYIRIVNHVQDPNRKSVPNKMSHTQISLSAEFKILKVGI